MWQFSKLFGKTLSKTSSTNKNLQNFSTAQKLTGHVRAAILLPLGGVVVRLGEGTVPKYQAP